MSEETVTMTEQAEASVETKTLLEQAIEATKQTDPSQVEVLMRAFSQQAMEGVVKWDKNLLVTMNNAISAIDKLISKQLVEVMHDAKFKKLEGSWRGLHHLTFNTQTSASLKIKVLNSSQNDIGKDLDKAAEFDQSQIFKKIYESEYGTPGGQPYGVLIGDYEFTNHPEQLDFLTNISGLAAASFCPFISAASPRLFGFDQWTELSKPRDLAKVFDSLEYAKWRGFRENEDSRFVSLVMPRVLARLPYGKDTKPVEAFDFEEAPLDEHDKMKAMLHDDYCWMNAAYVMGTKLTEAFNKYGWCTAIRGVEGGGKVEGLPLYTFNSDDGDIDMACPTEIGITDRRESELSKLGFLPLCHFKNTDYAVFFGAQTTQKPKQYDKAEATANAEISARLPYVMAVSRFSHYLKVMARDKIGSFMEASDVEKWLNNWIINYVNGNPDSGQEMKSKYPLAEAKVQVQEIPGKPGCYNAIAWLRPWLQMEELTASMRLVARIPELG